MLARTSQQGDTIIEILLAITVFSLLAVGALTVMNQATNSAQRTLEITLVKQQIDSQVEALRATHQGYSRLEDPNARENSQWVALKQLTDSGPGGGGKGVPLGDVGAGCPDTAALNDSFAMNPYNASIIDSSSGLKSINDNDAPVYPRVTTSNGLEDFGIWIESKEVPATGSTGAVSSYDFRVRACWLGAGTGSTPMQLETTVRLYDIAG